MLCWGFTGRHRLTGPSGSAALQREWLDDVGTVIRTQLAKLREMPKPLDRNLCDRVHICMHHNIYIYIYARGIPGRSRRLPPSCCSVIPAPPQAVAIRRLQRRSCPLQRAWPQWLLQPASGVPWIPKSRQQCQSRSFGSIASWKVPRTWPFRHFSLPCRTRRRAEIENRCFPGKVGLLFCDFV